MSAIVEPRRLAIADPLHGSPRRFVVAGQAAAIGGGDVKMYQWRKEAGEMNMVGLQTDVANIRAVAWSSLPTHRNLLALGLASGRVQLLPLSEASLSVSLSAAPQHVVLPIKHSRAVTSLSFAPIDGNILASALDRHRSDSSLMIWDIQDAVSRLPADTDAAFIRPPRLDTTLPSREGETRHIQQYCTAENVNCVAFMPDSFTLLASANGKVVRLYDLRQPSREASTSASAAAWPTRAVFGLSPNPRQPGSFASYEATPAGSIVRLWDTRKGEIAAFDAPGSVTGLEWVTGTSAIAVGSKEGVNVWDVYSGQVDGHETTSIGGMRQVVRPNQQLHSFALSPSDAPYGDVMFVLRDGSIGVGPIGNAPIVASSSRGELALSTSTISILSPDKPHGRPSDSPEPPGSPGMADEMFQLERRSNRFQLPPARVTAILAEASASRSRSASPASLPASSVLRGIRRAQSIREDGDEARDREGAQQILGVDMGFTIRRRAEDGYGLDKLELNAAIATRHQGADRLAGVWEFVQHLLEVMSPVHSRYGSYDLTHQGIWSIWSGYHTSTPAPSPQRKSAAWNALRSHPISRPSSTDSAKRPEPASRRGTDMRAKKEKDVETDPDYDAAIQALNQVRTERGGPGATGTNKLPHTERAAQRRMILALCGEDHAHSALSEINNLAEDGQRTKAACWAFFASQEGPAVTILLQSEDERHRLMGATVAGFMTQARAERGSEFWQRHWMSMVDKVEDAYVRAMLKRIAGEDWDAVIYDESLPLLDRVAIAVCNLSDRELTIFLRNRLTRVTTLGSLPGLALTGFSSAGLTILQRWLDRTSDLQTVALLSAFFPRAGLSPTELATVDRWRESYRTMMDSWRAFIGRCRFDGGWNEARRRLGEDKSEIQTLVVCPVCNNLLTRQTEEHLLRKNALRGTMSHPTARTVACLYCQNTLPRCCICLQHVRPEHEAEWVDVADTIDSAYVACQTCRHGGHAVHILSWFEGGLDGQPAHDVCPVAGCDCQCASL